MPRKCCVGKCRSMYAGTAEKVKVYGFPSEKEEFDKWVKAIPNQLEKGTKYIGVYEKHWPVGFASIKIKRCERPVNPPSLFKGIPNSFRPQTLVSTSRNIKKRKVDSDSRNSQKKQKTDKDVIKSWDSLVSFS